MSFKEKARRGVASSWTCTRRNLIVRGVKKLYKPERLRRLLAPEDRLIPSRQPAYPQLEIELERGRRSCSPRIDGTRTVAELMAFAEPARAGGAAHPGARCSRCRRWKAPV